MIMTDIREYGANAEIMVDGVWHVLHSSCIHYWIQLNNKRVPIEKTALLRIYSLKERIDFSSACQEAVDMGWENKEDVALQAPPPNDWEEF